MKSRFPSSSTTGTRLSMMMKSLPLPLIFVKAMPITLSGKIQEILCKTPAEPVGFERDSLSMAGKLLTKDGRKIPRTKGF